MRRLVFGGVALTVVGLAAPFALAVTSIGALAGAGGQTCGSPSGNPDIAMTALVVGTRMNASERVLLAAMEAGLVESGMRNLPGGDADSLGVLQQRPSQGWGTPAQIMDPVYAFTQFYRRAIPLDQAGYSGTAGQLAQAIQRSAFPLRYDERQGDALALLASLGEGMPVGCAPLAGGVSPVPAGYGTPGPCGRSPSTDYARYLILRTFGPQGVRYIGDCAPGTGHIAGSYHYPDANGQAHALDVMVGDNRPLGDRVAGWAVASAQPLNLIELIWYGRIWTPGRGWHPCSSGSPCAERHFDHPHLSFRRGT